MFSEAKITEIYCLADISFARFGRHQDTWRAVTLCFSMRNQ